VLALLCVLYFILFMDRVSLNTPRPMMMKDLGLTNTQLGIAFSAFSLPYAFFQLVGGWIGDRFGVRRTVLTGLTLLAIGTAALLARTHTAFNNRINNLKVRWIKCERQMHWTATRG